MTSNVLLDMMGPHVVRRVKWSWVGYGIAAYVGLRLMRRYGVFGAQADQAIQFIDRNAKSIAKQFAPIATDQRSSSASL